MNPEKMTYKTRLIILVFATIVSMAAVGFIWYKTFETSLIGSLNIEKGSAETKPAGQGNVFSSLTSMFKDIKFDFDWDRFNQ